MNIDRPSAYVWNLRASNIYVFLFHWPFHLQPLDCSETLWTALVPPLSFSGSIDSNALPSHLDGHLCGRPGTHQFIGTLKQFLWLIRRRPVRCCYAERDGSLTLPLTIPAGSQ